MAVSGDYLPANTQVVAVAGTTITLSSTIDATQFYTEIGSFNGSANGYNIQVDLAAAGAVGQLIGNEYILPITLNTTITNITYLYITSGKTTQQRKVYTISQYIAPPQGIGVGVYQFNGIPSATYYFAATDRNYTFRDAATIPYGSYPGVGTYFT
jgi:hypothetical protein